MSKNRTIEVTFAGIFFWAFMALLLLTGNCVCGSRDYVGEYLERRCAP